MLFQVVLSLEGFAADLTSVGDVVTMAALVNHEIVGLRMDKMITHVNYNARRCQWKEERFLGDLPW